jgi:inosine/xanthosine triphosphate pyrophosphatase family protein
MTKDQKREISHRGKAIAQMIPQLQKLAVIAPDE